MNAADKAEENRARMEFVHKKAMSVRLSSRFS